MIPRMSAPAWPPRRWLEGLLALGCAGLALWVQRRELAGFFGPDDFIVLERARGLLPGAHTLWRSLTGGCFVAAANLFGAVPHSYLTVGWALHGVNVLLLYAWARRAGGGVLAAGLAAGVFGVSRLHFTTLGQVATWGELLSVGFLLAMFLVLGRAGWIGTSISAALFLAALFSKESVALMPLVLLLPGTAGPNLRRRLWRCAPLLSLGALWWLYLFGTSARTSVFHGAAYAVGFGTNLFHSLMTYADWAVDFQRPVPDLFGTFSDTAWTTGVWVWAGLGAAAWLARRRHPLPALGATWWLLGLLPVLPLLYHSYLHYLYLPFAGLALAVGGTVEWMAVALAAPRRRRAPRNIRGGSAASPPAPVWASPLAVAVVLVNAVASDRLIADRTRERMPAYDLSIDPFVRKTELARRTAEGVAGPAQAGIRRIAFLVPEGQEQAYHDLIRETLDQGRGLRFLYPGVDSVVYVSRWGLAQLEFELFAQDREAHTKRLGRGPEALLEWSARLGKDGLGAQAQAALDSALRAWPGDPRLVTARRRLAAGP